MKKNMEFVDFKDFCSKRSYVKTRYYLLDKKDRREYRDYVYSHEKLVKSQPDKIWEYLNEPFGSFYYIPDSEMV